MTNAERMRLVSMKLAEIKDPEGLLEQQVKELEQELYWRKQLERAERLLTKYKERGT